MQPIRPFIRTQISLLQGQSHFVHLRRGDLVDVSSGTVLLVSRFYLEHDVMVQTTVVRRGSIYRVPVSGSFEIEAQCSVTVALACPARPDLMGQLRQRVTRQLFVSPRAMLYLLMAQGRKSVA